MNSERKICGSFPPRQFHIDELWTPIRLACNKIGTGIKPFVREDITVKLISSDAAPLEQVFISR